MQIMYRNAAGELITVGEPGSLRKKKSKDKDDKDKKEELYLIFRYDKGRAMGYFWGPDSGKNGQPAHFGVDAV